jgi:ribosome-binding factor A
MKSASGFIRRELAARLGWRATPELTFIPDDSIKHGARIAQLLNDVKE